MIQAPSFLSSGAIAAVGARSDYFASDAHYGSLAHQIAAALRGGGRFVLVTGDPPADPQVLSQALGNVMGPRYAVIDISCGPALRAEDLDRAVPMLPGPRASGGAAVEPECTVSASPLFVFDDFDQLSDRQIEEVCEGTLHADQIRTAGVLLAPLDFLVRLERPALRFLKDRIAAQFRFQEVGDHEAIGVLHDQLFSQRDRGAETRGFRRGILVGLAVGTSLMAVMAATIGIYIVHPTAEQVDGAAASIEQGSVASEEPSVLRPADAITTMVAPTWAAEDNETTSITATAPTLLSTPSPPMEGEDPPPLAVPPVARPPAGPRLSASEIAALVTRGDAFLSAGDITSARLFYERAAEGESGLAALQLAATFDRLLPGRAGLRGAAADPAQALFWYRRARELGVGEAEDRIKALENRPREPDRAR